MTVEELISELSRIEDKTLEVVFALGYVHYVITDIDVNTVQVDEDEDEECVVLS